MVADALHDAEWSGSSSVVNLKLCSVMCAPLMQKGEVFGVIYLGNDSVVSLFDERALEVLAPFAAQASLLVQNAMLLDSLRRENLTLKEAVSSRQYGDLIGSGASMREVYRRIEKVAATDISVLVTGETGTGKEMIARAIHQASPRAPGPFVPVDCGAIAEGLLASAEDGEQRTVSGTARRAADQSTLRCRTLGAGAPRQGFQKTFGHERLHMTQGRVDAAETEVRRDLAQSGGQPLRILLAADKIQDLPLSLSQGFHTTGQ